MRALVVAHHGEGFLGDGAHRLHVLFQPQIEHRAHMQAADGGVRVPGAARAVLLEDCGQPLGVVGEMLERHRAILDEGDRLPLLLHRHHDVETGGAHLGDGGLQGGIEHIDHAAPFRAAVVPAEAEIAHQLVQAFQPAQIFGVIVLAELHQQDASGSPRTNCVDRRPEHRDVAGKRDHGAVDQFDRDGRQLDDVLRRVHRLEEAAEMAGADRAAAEQRRRASVRCAWRSRACLRSRREYARG